MNLTQPGKKGKKGRGGEKKSCACLNNGDALVILAKPSFCPLRRGLFCPSLQSRKLTFACLAVIPPPLFFFAPTVFDCP